MKKFTFFLLLVVIILQGCINKDNNYQKNNNYHKEIKLVPVYDSWDAGGW